MAGKKFVGGILILTRSNRHNHLCPKSFSKSDRLNEAVTPEMSKKTHSRDGGSQSAGGLHRKGNTTSIAIT